MVAWYAIHASLPDLILIANRGFSILARSKACSTLFCLKRLQHSTRPGPYVAWQGGFALDRAAGGLFAEQSLASALFWHWDYAAPQDHDLRRLALARAQAHGFLLRHHMVHRLAARRIGTSLRPIWEGCVAASTRHCACAGGKAKELGLAQPSIGSGSADSRVSFSR